MLLESSQAFPLHPPPPSPPPTPTVNPHTVVLAHGSFTYVLSASFNQCPPPWFSSLEFLWRRRNRKGREKELKTEKEGGGWASVDQTLRVRKSSLPESAASPFVS